jgi:hypothetical protein
MEIKSRKLKPSYLGDKPGYMIEVIISQSDKTQNIPIMRIYKRSDYYENDINGQEFNTIKEAIQYAHKYAIEFHPFLTAFI